LITLFDDDSELFIKGDFDGGCYGGAVSDGAQLTVTGTITGGPFNSYDDSTVNIPSCDNVISRDNSTCNAGLQSVNFDVDVGDLL